MWHMRVLVFLYTGIRYALVCMLSMCPLCKYSWTSSWTPTFVMFFEDSQLISCSTISDRILRPLGTLLGQKEHDVIMWSSNLVALSHLFGRRIRQIRFGVCKWFGCWRCVSCSKPANDELNWGAHEKIAVLTANTELLKPMATLIHDECGVDFSDNRFLFVARHKM